jgi:hypothetical protein
MRAAAVDVVADGALLAAGCRPLDPSRTDFLGQAATEESISKLATRPRDEL